MDSFQKQFPDYQIIPMKKSKLSAPVLLIGTFLIIGLVGYIVFSKLGTMQVPMSNMAGVNSMTLSTLKNLALAQANSGQYQEAAKNFADYFQLGGSEADSMATYATVLSTLGHSSEALEWSRKAVAKDPDSKAARFIKDSLERKSR